MTERPVPSIRRAPFSTIGRGWACAATRGAVDSTDRKIPSVTQANGRLTVFILFGTSLIRDTSAGSYCGQTRTYQQEEAGPMIGIIGSLFGHGR